MSSALDQQLALDSALAEWASRRLGFDRRALRFERLRLVAEREARRLGQPAFERALVEGEAGLDAALVAAATVGETYFFRQREHFDLLAQLPFRGTAQAPLLAWSAACASGEEAYSLAVCLRRERGLEAPALQVWGTDINEAALVSARAAAYGRWSFRASTLEGGLSDPAAEAVRDEALRKEVLDPRTQACVRFARHNLLEAATFDGQSGPRFHVIFCRNALVYFQAEAASLALHNLVGALRPGGWLILGNMDIAAAPAGTRRVGPPHLCVYERVSELAAPVRAEPLVAPPAPAIRRPPAPSALSSAAEPAAESDPEQAIDWHRGILAQMEAGEEANAMLELQALVEAFPGYLPGWFEHGLALNRRGQKALAAESLRKTLALAKGHAPEDQVAGPEPLSTDFYVGNAEAFLQSLGDSL